MTGNAGEKKTYSREGYLEENYHYFHLRDTAGQERDFHFHEFDKIVLLLSGRVEYAVEGRSYDLRPWDILLVKHHAIHKAMIDKSEPYERIILYLDGSYYDQLLPEARLTDCFDEADRRGEYRLVPDEEQRRELEETLRALSGPRGMSASAPKPCATRISSSFWYRSGGSARYRNRRRSAMTPRSAKPSRTSTSIWEKSSR